MMKESQAAFLQNLNCDICSQLSIWLDSKEAAQYLKISEASLRNNVSLGKIPYYKLGRRNRYLRSELDQVMLKNKGTYYDCTI